MDLTGRDRKDGRRSQVYDRAVSDGAKATLMSAVIYTFPLTGVLFPLPLILFPPPPSLNSKDLPLL